jgi:hypothetical protein
LTLDERHLGLPVAVFKDVRLSKQREFSTIKAKKKSKVGGKRRSVKAKKLYCEAKEPYCERKRILRGRSFKRIICRLNEPYIGAS